MWTGMYYNAIICFLVAVFAFRAVFFIYKKSKGSVVDLSFATAWFLAGLIWLFFGISLIFFPLGHIKLALWLNQYIVQTAASLFSIASAAYIFRRLCKNNFLYVAAVLVIAILTAIALGFNYQLGTVHLTKTTYYSFEYDLSSRYWTIFSQVFFVLYFFALLDFLTNFYNWFKRKELFKQKYLFATLSLLVYGLIGYFEELSVYATWISMLFRSSLIFCAYIAYLAYNEEEI
jgi:hypothetical protein